MSPDSFVTYLPDRSRTDAARASAEDPPPENERAVATTVVPGPLGLALVLRPQQTEEEKPIGQLNRLPETRADGQALPRVDALHIEGAVIGCKDRKATSGSAPGDLNADLILHALCIDKLPVDQRARAYKLRSAASDIPAEAWYCQNELPFLSASGMAGTHAKGYPKETHQTQQSLCTH